MPNLKLVDKQDLEDFQIPASDTKGHSARHWFRCIPAMARQVEQIIQARTFPYRTKGDLLRHALHRHMRWLNNINPTPTVSGQVDAILEIMRDEEMNNDFALVFNKVDERINNHIMLGENKEASRLVLVIQSHVNRMPEGFWKGKYKAKIAEKYGMLIKGTERASIGDMDDEDL